MPNPYYGRPLDGPPIPDRWTGPPGPPEGPINDRPPEVWPSQVPAGPNRSRRIIELAIFIGLLAVLAYILTGQFHSNPFPERPQGGRLLIDNAGIFGEGGQATEAFLRLLRDEYGIEAFVVTLPSLKGLGEIERAATKMMFVWKIGDRYANQGLLVLYAQAERRVVMDVSFALEDVFTDAFIGKAEDIALEPAFLEGHPGAGLDAFRDAVEARAALKRKGGYTSKEVESLDGKFPPPAPSAAKRSR